MADGGNTVTSGEKDITSGSGPDPETSCRSCSYDGTHNEGVWFCFDCDEMLCEECYKYHRKLPFARGHVVKRHDSLSTDEMHKTVKDTCSDICKTHDGKVMEYYCFSHDCIGCAACITLDHKHCEDAGFIPNIAKSEFAIAEVKYVAEKLNNLDLQSEKIVKLADENRKYTQKYSQKVTTDVEDIRTKVIKSLDEFKEGVEKKLSLFADEDSEKMTNVKLLCSKIKKDVEKIESKQTTLQNSAMHCRLFCETWKCKAKIKSLEASLHTANQKTVVQRVELNLGKQGEKLIRNIKSIGTLSRKGLGNSKLNHSKDISVKTSSDTKKCKITGIARLPDEMLALADNHNGKLKLLDTSSGVITAELKLTSEPWDITVVSETTIATTLPKEGKLLFVDVSRTAFYVYKNITFSGKCRGLSYKDHTFIITFVDPGKVEIVDMEGIVLRNVPTSFKVPSYTSFTDENCIILSNCGDDGVHSLMIVDSEGNERVTYKDKQLEGPCAIIEQDGFIYVCGWRSHNILAINANTKAFKKILGQESGLFQPYSICHDIQNCHLYVGVRDVDYVKVFDVV